MSKDKAKVQPQRVKFEDASKTTPPGEPSCVTVGSARDVLKGKTMEEFLRAAEAEEERNGKQEPHA